MQVDYGGQRQRKSAHESYPDAHYLERRDVNIIK